jgi:hypothetical protein
MVRGVPETVRRSEIILEGRNFMKMASSKLQVMKGGVRIPVWADKFEGGDLIEAEIEKMLADDKEIERLGIRYSSARRSYLGSENYTRGIAGRRGRVLDVDSANGTSKEGDLSDTISGQGAVEDERLGPSLDCSGTEQPVHEDSDGGRRLGRERSGKG